MKAIHFAIGFFAVSLGVSHAMTVRSLNFEQLVDAADEIAMGVVESVVAERGPLNDPPEVRVSIRVSERFKGAPSNPWTFRQLGRRLPDGTIRVFSGLPEFRVGETVVVFMPKPGSRGLASPVGMGQGLFRAVGRSSGDDLRVANEFHNLSLFTSLQGNGVRQLSRKWGLDVSDTERSNLTVGRLRELLHAHRFGSPR